MAVPIGAAVQINAVGTVYGQTTVTTFHYLFESGGPLPDGVEPDILAAAWMASVGSAFIDAISADWHMVMVECRDPRTNPVWASGFALDSTPGAGPNEACPPSVAAVITRRTALAGRTYRGRIYMPAVPVAWQLEGRTSAGGPPAYQTFADQLATVVDVPGLGPAAELVPVVWSRKLQASTRITSAIPRDILRSQRRREIGVGS